VTDITQPRRTLTPPTTTKSPQDRRTSYQKVLEILNIFRTIGKIEDTGYGFSGRAIKVVGLDPSVCVVGWFDIRDGRYGVSFEISIPPVTQEESGAYLRGEKDVPGLKRFQVFFDAMEARKATYEIQFDASENAQVEIALDSVFGPR